MLINESIKQCRESRKLSQEYVAKKMGVSKQFIFQLEKGERQIPVDRLIQMSNILDCSLDELVGRKIKEEF